jgi:hypothetical protein
MPRSFAGRKNGRIASLPGHAVSKKSGAAGEYREERFPADTGRKPPRGQHHLSEGTIRIDLMIPGISPWSVRKAPDLFSPLKAKIYSPFSVEVKI